MTFEILKSRITHGILLTFQTVFLIFFYYYYNALPPLIARLNNPLFPGFRDRLGDGDVG